MSDDHTFAALSRRACPPLVDALVAVASTWRAVDAAWVDAQLDELALPLFSVGPEGRTRAAALGELVTRAFREDSISVEALWIHEALATRRGHPVVIAAIATELGLRAGWTITVCSSPTAWYAGLRDGDVLWLVEAAGLGGATPATVRRHCAHEIAFVLLTGLAERFPGPRDQVHARSLRDQLALFEPPGDPGRGLLGALWTDEA
jgi:hypothetical protein